jgi:hypothetical protein
MRYVGSYRVKLRIDLSPNRVATVNEIVPKKDSG